MVVVSGFLPVPLPMMIPFMGAQSLVIGKMFGEGFQYGKRKISAMSNEDFNALTFKDMMQNARDEMQASIPTMQAALRDMQPLVETVVHEFFDYIKIIAAMVPEETRKLTGGAAILDVSGKTLNLTQEQRDWLEAQGKIPDTEFLHDMGIGAGATGGSGTALPLHRPSTIQGLTVAQAQEAARLRQVQFEKAREAARLAAIPGRLAISKTVQPVPQVSQVRAITTKQTAGQSQRLERTRLIRLISIQSNTITKSAHIASKLQMSKYVSQLRILQQKLVNLLARYRF